MNNIKISFCTPIIFDLPRNGKSLPAIEKTINFFEKYFCLKGSEIFLVDSELPFPDVLFNRQGRFNTTSSSSPVLFTVIKVLSYFTLILPLIVFLGKCIFRCVYSFSEKKKPSSPDLSQVTSPNLPKPSSVDKDVVLPKPSFPKPSEFVLPPSLVSSKKIVTTQPVLPLPHDTSAGVFQIPTFLQDIATLDTNVSLDPNVLDGNLVQAALMKVAGSVQQRLPHNSINYLREVNGWLFFEFKLLFPGVIFKTFQGGGSLTSTLSDLDETILEQAVKDSYKNLQELQKYVRSFVSIEHLYIPKHKLFKIQVPAKLSFIALEKMTLHHSPYSSLAWKLQDQQLHAAFEELTVLAEEMGLHGIKSGAVFPRFVNNRWSLVLCEPQFMSALDDGKVAVGVMELIDNIHSEEGLKVVSHAVSRRHKQVVKEPIQKRSQELAFMKKHEKFHLDQNTSPYTLCPIQLNDLNVLKLDLTETASLISSSKPITMKEVVKQVLEDINIAISTRAEIVSGFPLAYFVCLTPEKVLMTLPYDHVVSSRGVRYQDLSSEEKKGLWIYKILDALVEAKVIAAWSVNTIKGNNNSLRPLIKIIL